MGNRVERVRTNISESEMTAAVISGWQQLFGSPPAKEQVAMVMAQNALETGHRKSMYNYNVGNITTDGKGEYNYFDDLTTDEQTSPGKWEKKNLKYRAYDTLQDGVTDYLRFLSKPGGRYAQAWQHILNPNPSSYSKALKDANYYTANESAYTKNLVSLFDKFNKSNTYESAQTLVATPKSSSGLTGTNPPSQPSIVSSTNTPTQNPMSQNIPLSDLDKLQQELSKVSSDNSSAATGLDDFVNIYLKKISQANKKNYIKYLPNNLINIKVKSAFVVDKIEFANILCSALDEELLSNSFIHTNGRDVEIECNINGSENTCFRAVSEVAQVVADNFELATKKIGSVKVGVDIAINKKSSYPPIDLKVAELNHRKFLFKFT